ncbi:MAG: T9SS type A sorting domain-containing protein [Bacteroidetes bacterium]|nr:T9SS type A sorting domain-containing protein [Bacteroidota bacterium]
MAQCPTPTITPSGPVDLCTGGSVTLTATAGVSYLWSTGATTQAINVTTAGSFIVTVDDGAGCIVASAATDVSLNSSSPANINGIIGANKVCPGQSLVYSVSPVPRTAFYVWTLPAGATSGGLSVIQTASPSITIDFSGGFVASSISITANNGCGVKGPVSKNVGLDLPSTPGVISGPVVTCALSTYTYSVPLVAGVTSYNWTAPIGSVVVGQGTNQVDITFPAGYISGSVKVANQNACGTSPQRSLSTRSVPSSPQAITGPTVGLCGSTETYTIPPVTNATSYTWTAPAGSSVVNGQGTTSADVLFSGVLNNGYVRVVANNICGASGERKLRVDGEVIVTSNPANVAVCAGIPASFTINTLGNTVIYRWQKDGVDLVDGGTISGSSAAILNISSTVVGDAGLYSCIVSNNCSVPDTSESATLTVSDVPGSPGPITGAAVGCPGDSNVPYSVGTAPGATNYAWQVTNGAVIASGQGTTAITVDFGPSTNSGYDIFVITENACGATLDTSETWVRRSISIPNFSTAPLSACAGQNNVAFDVNPVVGATSYTWTAPANATIATGQFTDAVTVDFGPSFTSGQICVTGTNACVTTVPRCKTVVSVPSYPGAVTGPIINLCNSSASYSIPAVASATNYTWTVPAGASISSGQTTTGISVDFGPTFTSGNITVIAKNLCGDSQVRVRDVSAAPAKPGTISGNAAPCANSAGNVYSVAAVTGATSYTWTIPSGASITSGAGTNSVTISFGSVASALTVKAVNACATGAGSTLAISFSCRIQASEVNNGFSVYPNPASDRITISNADGIDGMVTVKISDVAGRTLINQLANSENGNTTIDVSSLKTGVYLIETSIGNERFVSRFVKD